MILYNISYGYLIRLKFTTKLNFIFPTLFFIYLIEVGPLIRGPTGVKFRGQKYFHPKVGHLVPHQSCGRVDYEKNRLSIRHYDVKIGQKYQIYSNLALNIDLQEDFNRLSSFSLGHHLNAR